MSDQERKDKDKRRIRLMRLIVSRMIEEGDADAAVLIVSFHDRDVTSSRMTTAGNRILCARLVSAANDSIEEWEDDPND
jgi:hypothetical protein